jgi:hypothetical protein
LISRFALDTCLRQCEANPLLKQLPEKHAFDLAMLYQKYFATTRCWILANDLFRLAYFDSHPIVGFWFTFWHDFWIWNQDLKLVDAHKAEFNPFNAASVCYTPMPRDQLERRLKHTGILGRRAWFGLRTGYLNSSILDRLYKRIDSMAKELDPNPAVAGLCIHQSKIRADST